MTTASRGARSDRIFNRRLTERQPAAVLKAATEHDVVLGVRLASERGWQVAVRSGGHSWAQWSVRSDALVIDLGGLQELSYDDATGIVSASPAVQGGAVLAPYLDARGRFFPGGHCPTVGIGGFLLQGGQGWNSRGWGWAAEYVEAIDVVTATGELVRADASRTPTSTGPPAAPARASSAWSPASTSAPCPRPVTSRRPCRPTPSTTSTR